MSKKITVALVLIVAVLFIGVLATHMAKASWDYTPPKPADDIADFLRAVPAKLTKKYGHSDRTTVIYNIAFMRDVCKGYETRMAATEAQVAALEAQVKALTATTAPIPETGKEDNGN